MPTRRRSRRRTFLARILRLSAALLLLAVATRTQATCTCGDTAACGSSPPCSGKTPGEHCLESARKECEVLEGNPAGITCCCGCRLPNQRSCLPPAAAGGAARALATPGCGDSKVQKAAEVAVAKASRKADEAEAACEKGQVKKEQAKLAEAATVLTAFEKQLPKLARKDHLSADCVASIAGDVGRVAEDFKVAATACPFVILNVSTLVPSLTAQSQCSQVVSDPAGISCAAGHICSAKFGLTGSVQLTAPDAGARFSGDCDPTGRVDLAQAHRTTCALECECRTDDSTTTSTVTTTSTLEVTTTSTTVPCAGAIQPCSSDANCCEGYECRRRVNLDGTSQSLCGPQLPCPGFLQSDTFPITNPIWSQAQGYASYSRDFQNFDLPKCAQGPQYHVIDAGTGVDLAATPFPPKIGSWLLTHSPGAGFFQLTLALINDTPNDLQGGDVKDVYFLTSWGGSAASTTTTSVASSTTSTSSTSTTSTTERCSGGDITDGQLITQPASGQCASYHFTAQLPTCVTPTCATLLSTPSEPDHVVLQNPLFPPQPSKDWTAAPEGPVSGNNSIEFELNLCNRARKSPGGATWPSPVFFTVQWDCHP